MSIRTRMDQAGLRVLSGGVTPAELQAAGDPDESVEITVRVPFWVRQTLYQRSQEASQTMKCFLVRTIRPPKGLGLARNSGEVKRLARHAPTPQSPTSPFGNGARQPIVQLSVMVPREYQRRLRVWARNEGLSVNRLLIREIGLLRDRGP